MSCPEQTLSVHRGDTRAPSLLAPNPSHFQFTKSFYPKKEEVSCPFFPFLNDSMSTQTSDSITIRLKMFFSLFFSDFLNCLQNKWEKRPTAKSRSAKKAEEKRVDKSYTTDLRTLKPQIFGRLTEIESSYLYLTKNFIGETNVWEAGGACCSKHLHRSQLETFSLRAVFPCNNKASLRDNSEILMFYLYHNNPW